MVKKIAYTRKIPERRRYLKYIKPTKLIKIPVTIKFRNKDGSIVKFKATKIIKKPIKKKDKKTIKKGRR